MKPEAKCSDCRVQFKVLISFMNLQGTYSPINEILSSCILYYTASHGNARFVLAFVGKVLMVTLKPVLPEDLTWLIRAIIPQQNLWIGKNTER